MLHCCNLSWLERKEWSSAHERKPVKLEEHFLNRPEMRQFSGETFYAGSKWNWKFTFQSCTKYRIHIDCLLTENDDLINIQNTLRKQINQFQSNIKTFAANLQNLENYIKKKHCKKRSKDKNIFKSMTRLIQMTVLQFLIF